jgi:hypothetical protein
MFDTLVRKKKINKYKLEQEFSNDEELFHFKNNPSIQKLDEIHIKKITQKMTELTFNGNFDCPTCVLNISELPIHCKYD